MLNTWFYEQNYAHAKGKKVKVLLVLIAISIEAHGQCDPKTAE